MGPFVFQCVSMCFTFSALRAYSLNMYCLLKLIVKSYHHFNVISCNCICNFSEWNLFECKEICIIIDSILIFQCFWLCNLPLNKEIRYASIDRNICLWYNIYHTAVFVIKFYSKDKINAYFQNNYNLAWGKCIKRLGNTILKLIFIDKILELTA